MKKNTTANLMSFNQISQIVEFLANIVTIFGFIIGLLYVDKIYNRIEVNIQEKYIANIGKVEIAVPEKDYSKIALNLHKLKEEIFEIKKAGEL